MPIFDFCDSLENSPTNRKTKAPKPFSDFGAVFSIPARQGAEDCLVVPSARLELAQLSPLPPQDSVSTNFTTTADLFATACCILREPFKNNSAQQHPSKQAVIVIAILRGTMDCFQFLPWAEHTRASLKTACHAMHQIIGSPQARYRESWKRHRGWPVPTLRWQQPRPHLPQEPLPHWMP